jgi:ribosome maturation factor RimP
LNTIEITDWVKRFLNTLDSETLYLVDVDWSKKVNKLEVFIESDGDLTLGDVQKISRQMEEAIDQQNILGEAYRLDVSSPGIDRPLKLKRQYAKNVGRIVMIELQDGNSLVGKLNLVGEKHLSLSPEIPGHKNRKPTYEEAINIAWEEIKQTIVQIRF